MNQLLIITLFMLMPMRAEAVHDIDLTKIRSDVAQIEIETRAYRQRKSGGGL